MPWHGNRIVIPANAGIQNGRSGSASRILDTGVRRYDELPQRLSPACACSSMPWHGNRIVVPANAGIQNGRSGSASRILDTGVRRYDESGADGMSC